jgi:hypothetical protein
VTRQPRRSPRSSGSNAAYLCVPALRKRGQEKGKPRILGAVAAEAAAVVVIIITIMMMMMMMKMTTRRR